MLKPETSQNESARLKVLNHLKLINTPIGHGFDRITRLAKRIFHMPIVAIILMDKDKQWIKSGLGVGLAEIARDVSFCSQTLLKEEIFLIEDTFLDSGFKDNPLVTHSPGIRFYAGYPIHAQNEKIGAFCLMDTQPRSFSEEECRILEDLAFLVDCHIKYHRMPNAPDKFLQELDQEARKIYLDETTHLWNQKGIKKIVDHYIKGSKKNKSNFAFILLDIDHFANLQHRYNAEIMSKILQMVATTIINSCREGDIFGHWEEGKFAIMIPSALRKNAWVVAERIRKNIEKNVITMGNSYLHLTATLGLAFYHLEKHEKIEALLVEADNALKQGQSMGKNQVAIYGVLVQ